MLRWGRYKTTSCGIGLLLAISAHAYVQSERSPGKPYFLGSPANVEYVVHSGTRAGQTNLNDEEIITPDSSPTAAILAALGRWSSISGSVLNFDPPIAVGSDTVQIDSQNLITFADTSSNRSIVGGAVAVTQLISASDGQLTDTDIIFNPDFEFSTTLRPGTFDIEGTLVHELGHAIGMSHSGSVSSTMFASTARGSADLRTLSADDVAFARGAYPTFGLSNLGTLVVTTSFASGQTARGILVTAVSRETNTLFSSHTDTTGRAVMAGMPPGEYILYAEPANGPSSPGQFSQFGVSASIATTFAGGVNAPQTFFVQPLATTSANFAVRTGIDALNIEGAGGADPGEFVRSDFGAIANPGKDYFVEIYGTGLDDPAITLSSISFLGTGVSVSGPLERSEVTLSDNTTRPLLRFNISVDASAPAGVLSVMLRQGDELSLFTGFLEIETPTPTPTFSTAGVVNAASFEAGAISPGGIFSIFGEAFVSANAGDTFFDPLSAGLIEILDGVSVLVNDRPAPLFFVGPGQINAQAPIDLEPGTFVPIRILHNEVSSAEIFVLVGLSSPGVFVLAETKRVVAINQDGTLNSATNPADRGSIVSFYATGLGSVDPPLPTGQPAELSGPLHHVTASVAATIGAQDAVVHFAGLAPGFVGLVQVNIEIPAAAPTGDAIPVDLLAGRIASQQGLTVSIR